jgi:hypothetical protein
LRSPFFNLLIKGRRGEEESLPGGTTKELFGAKVEPGGKIIFPAAQPPLAKETQKGEAGVFAYASDLPDLKTQRPTVEPKVAPEYVPEAKTELPQIPISPLPATGERQPKAVPEALPEIPPATTGLPGRRSVLKAEPKRRETPVGEAKTAAPAPTPTVTPMPALRSESVQPAANQVRAAGSTASVERIKALAGEIVDKMETTHGPKGDAKVDIQFNSRTLQGLQVSISKQDTGVSIRFNTASEQISQLLTQNVQALVQTLAAKGVEVGDVRIVPNTPSGSTSGSRQDSRQGSRGGSGDGGRGGQRGGR